MEKARSNKKKILIVDDNPMNVKLLAARLPSDKYETIYAYNGEEALKKVALEPPDLILLDIMMPGIDGYEVTRRLKQAPKTKAIPVVLVTALDGEENKAGGLAAGADEYLNKPIDPAGLLTSIDILLRPKPGQKVTQE